jgi:hypothetical protein
MLFQALSPRMSASAPAKALTSEGNVYAQQRMRQNKKLNFFPDGVASKKALTALSDAVQSAKISRKIRAF